MSTTTQSYLNAKKAYAEAQAAYKETTKAYFAEGTKEMFRQHPVMESFAWQQYTPYFCDGEPCYFSVWTDEVYINDEDIEDDWDDVTGEWVPPDDELGRAKQAVTKFLDTILDEDFLEMFGDHVRVVVTPNGVE